MLKNLNAIVFLIALIFTLTSCYSASDSSGGDTDNDADTDADSDADSDTDSDSDLDTDTDTDSETITDDGVLFFEDFEGFEVGDYIVETSGFPWQEVGLDAQVSDDEAFSGTNSLYFVDHAGILLNTNYDSGNYGISFMLYVGNGLMAKYDFIENLDGDSSATGFEAYLYAGGVGMLVIDELQLPFKFTEGEWISCDHIIDIDNNLASISIDGHKVYIWEWNSSMDGILFYGNPDPPGATFYIDDVKIEAL